MEEFADPSDLVDVTHTPRSLRRKWVPPPLLVRDDGDPVTMPFAVLPPSFAHESQLHGSCGDPFSSQGDPGDFHSRAKGILRVKLTTYAHPPKVKEQVDVQRPRRRSSNSLTSLRHSVPLAPLLSEMKTVDGQPLKVQVQTPARTRRYSMTQQSTLLGDREGTVKNRRRIRCSKTHVAGPLLVTKPTTRLGASGNLDTRPGGSLQLSSAGLMLGVPVDPYRRGANSPPSPRPCASAPLPCRKPRPSVRSHASRTSRTSNSSLSASTRGNLGIPIDPYRRGANSPPSPRPCASAPLPCRKPRPSVRSHASRTSRTSNSSLSASTRGNLGIPIDPYRRGANSPPSPRPCASAPLPYVGHRKPQSLALPVQSSLGIPVDPYRRGANSPPSPRPCASAPLPCRKPRPSVRSHASRTSRTSNSSLSASTRGNLGIPIDPYRRGANSPPSPRPYRFTPPLSNAHTFSSP